MAKSNLDIWEKVRAVPPEALTPILGGRLKGKSDINPVWRLKSLTEQFGPCGIGWYYEILKQWLEPGANGEVAAFVNINLFYKADGEWSKGVFGTGGSSFVAKESGGLYVSDECWKMALTDAISVSCKAIGIAADVYWNKDTTKYTVKPETTPKTASVTSIVPPVVPPTPPVSEKQQIVNYIGHLLYPDAVGKEKGAPDGFCYDIYSKLLTSYNGHNPNIKKLTDLNIDQLKDMAQKMDMPPVLR
jgi:hypothetical protein